MYTEILRSITGIEIFPVIALLLFVTVFTAAIVRAMRMDRGRVEHLSSLPLESESSVRGSGAGRGAPAGEKVRS